MFITPPPLAEGDCVAIVSPASAVNPEYIDGAVRFLENSGFRVKVMPHAKGPADGSFSSSVENRLSDLLSAIRDPEVKCIFCSRGGYGCVHLLPHLPGAEIAANPKWLVGFSDISALHSLWSHSGVESIHASMAKHLAIESPEHSSTVRLLEIIQGKQVSPVDFPPHPYNRTGVASGILSGGNLAVLNGLASTPFDLLGKDFPKGKILFIEDVSEAIYAVERMLWRMWLSGCFKNVNALIVGQFAEYHPDRNHSSMEQMIDSFLKKTGIAGIPVAFGIPIGHIRDNTPLVEGRMSVITVSPEGVKLGDYE